MPTAGQYLETARALIDSYEKLGGFSADTYKPAPQLHAMAEGRYLSAISALREAGSISAPDFVRRTQDALARLEQTAVVDTEGSIAWGLGFPYREYPANEAFVVTSATALRGLCDAYRVRPSERLLSMIRRSASWLQGVNRVDVPTRTNTRVPVYSAGLRELILNSVAMWAAALSDAEAVTGTALQADVAAVADWLISHYVPEIGWPYSPDRQSFDLVHEAYILNALTALKPNFDVERAAMEVLGGFRHQDVLVDTLESVEFEDAIQRATRSGGVSIAFRGGRTLLVSSNKARQWSIGAVLELMSRMALRSGRAYWLVQIRRFAGSKILDVPSEAEPGAHDFRQEMHRAHGMAMAFLAIRKAAHDAA